MKILFLSLLIFISSCDKVEHEQKKELQISQSQLADTPVQENKKAESKVNYPKIEWESLAPKEFSADVIIEKYREKIDKLEDDSKEALELFQKIAKEINNAPLNDEMADKAVTLDGFIAPLNQQNGLINEFLFVPYFGACIHVPPPPNNQTILVTLKPGEGIKLEDSEMPFTISGIIQTQGKKTEIGDAGYSILNASFKLYDENE